jgi:hypothetical protein
MQRRSLLKYIPLGLLGGIPLFRYFFNNNKNKRKIQCKLTKPNFALGHRLRGGDFPLPSTKEHHAVIIIGGGIAGLSACRGLAQKGINDFLLLELEKTIGGNSAYGNNRYSSFPLGAHYLPLPNLHHNALLDFLGEIGVIKGYDKKGLPIYDEFSLCHAPQERLLIQGHWQEGIVPSYGIDKEDALQIKRFMAYVKMLKDTKGSDEKFAFDIPIVESSKDKQYIDLQQVVFKDWLFDNGFTATSLHWYLDYCCRDDYGAGIGKVSAWAGLHYHAARKGIGANVAQDAVLTWVNGNGFLMEQLAQYAKDKYKTSQLVYDVVPTDSSVTLKVFDANKNITCEYTCEKLVIATPYFIAQRLLKIRPDVARQVEYYPWIVANVTLDGFQTEMNWDNVLYQGKGLGYVFAQHQNIGPLPVKKVISYYRPLDNFETASEARHWAMQQDEVSFQQMIEEELSQIHPTIRDFMEQIEIHVWGHGMICPTPTFFEQTINHNPHPRIILAHSDLSGVSIFEEAFFAGLRAI